MENGALVMPPTICLDHGKNKQKNMSSYSLSQRVAARFFEYPFVRIILHMPPAHPPAQMRPLAIS